MPGSLLSLLAIALGISFLSQAIFFVLASIFKTDIFTDLSYSLGFIAVTALLYTKIPYPSQIQSLTLMLVLFWALRLGGYLFFRILKMKKDQRFNGIRENFWAFAKFWILQAITIWIILLPVIFILILPHPSLIDPVDIPSLHRSKPPWTMRNTISSFGLALWTLGLGIETLADIQKFMFKNNSKNKGKWIEKGLWKYARHPNYFGEMLVWWGIFILVLPYMFPWYWHLNDWSWATAALGPIFITFLLMKVTGIPPLEKRYQKKYGKNNKYKEYLKRTRLLVPLPK